MTGGNNWMLPRCFRRAIYGFCVYNVVYQVAGYRIVFIGRTLPSSASRRYFVLPAVFRNCKGSPALPHVSYTQPVINVIERRSYHPWIAHQAMSTFTQAFRRFPGIFPKRRTTNIPTLSIDTHHYTRPPDYHLNQHTAVCVRRAALSRLNLDRSMILDVDMSGAPSTEHGLEAAEQAWLPARVGALGWEPNAGGRPGPRMADLSSVLDPSRLAENSVRLNIKLMRWRALPELDVELLARTKCLLLGAGEEARSGKITDFVSWHGQVFFVQMKWLGSCWCLGLPTFFWCTSMLSVFGTERCKPTGVL